MANCRGSDERLAYEHALTESHGPGTYALQAPRLCDGMYVSDPRISAQGHLASVCGDVPLIDVDSELIGITRRLGSCPESKYTPGSVPFCKLVHVRQDAAREAAFEAEDCRMSNPPCTLRGTGINRWEWLCTDPQATALEPYARCVNYRTIVKDNHRIEAITEPRTPPKLETEFVPDRHTWSEFTVEGLPKRPIQKHWRTAREVACISGQHTDVARGKGVDR